MADNKYLYDITAIPDSQRANTARNMESLYRKPVQTEPIQKAEEHILEKGGEGTRGGKVIGHTESGKPIYANKKAHEYTDFNAKEHKEAAWAHGEHTKTGTGKIGTSDKHMHHQMQQTAHMNAGEEKRMDEESLKKDSIGKTRSGKTIYNKPDHKGHKDFTAQDHFDASDHHTAKALDHHVAMEKIKKEDLHHGRGGALNRDFFAKKEHTEHAIEHERLGLNKQSEEEDTEVEKAEKIIIGACIENMIEKGEISDALGRGYGPASEAIKFNRTGKEIKEKIPAILTSLTLESGKISGQMEEIAKEIGIEPTIPRNSYFAKNIAYLSYDWELCDPKYDTVSQKYNDATVQNQLCSKSQLSGTYT